MPQDESVASLRFRSRMRQVGIVTGLLLAAWCVMVFTHEAGHLVGGWLGGATLQACDLRPWQLPYSLFDPDPYPLLTLWSGPVLGAALPVLLAVSFRSHAIWLIAYFCVLANGLYLAVAWTSGDRFLDTPQLLAHGAWPVSIVVYCGLTIVLGYLGVRRTLGSVWQSASE